MSSNWKSLKSKLSSGDSAETAKKRKRTELSDAARSLTGDGESVGAAVTTEKESSGVGGGRISAVEKEKYVAVDCEMVGIGPTGKQSALARCSIVDYDGNVLYDEVVRPPVFVTDFRTKWSGIRKQDLRQGHAISLADCQRDVAAILKGKILVGHGLVNDLDVLMLSHPRHSIRDTACYRPLMRPHGRKAGKFRPRALKDLTQQHLKKTIQTGEHDPAEDARAAMFLYRMFREQWEKDLKDRKKAKREAFLGIRNKVEEEVQPEVDAADGDRDGDSSDEEDRGGRECEAEGKEEVDGEKEEEEYGEGLEGVIMSEFKKQSKKGGGSEEGRSSVVVSRHSSSYNSKGGRGAVKLKGGSGGRGSGRGSGRGRAGGMFEDCSVDKRGVPLRDISSIKN